MRRAYSLLLLIPLLACTSGATGRDVYGHPLGTNVQGDVNDRDVEGIRPRDGQGNTPKDMYGNRVGTDK